MKYSFLLVIVIFISCKTESSKVNPEEIELGTIKIEVNGSDEAKPLFEEGLLLLHSFEYEDAAEKFKEARTIDPDFGMAYWGEAMTKNHPLWREQEKEEALEIINLLGDSIEDRIAKFSSEFEKDMFEALQILYGEGTKAERDVAYSNFMESLTKKYPENHEVSAFYALSLLGSVKGGRDYETYGKGAKIAQSIIDENPNHPGALHYLIHSYDDPDNAPKALKAANSYSKVAPDAGHALHMPSHIYVALGMWDEVVSSNIAAWQADKTRKENKDLDNDALNYHAFKWQMYGHLQKEEYAKARELVEEMRTYCGEKSSPRAKSHLAMMKAAYFIESGLWDDTLLEDTFDYFDLSINVIASHILTQGMGAFQKEDNVLLNKCINILDKQINGTYNEVISAGQQMCSGSYTRGKSSQLQLDRSKVMLMELQALQAMAKNDNDLAEKILVEASQLEEATSYVYGPPEIVKPSHELLGDFLKSQNRHKEAVKYYNKVLERAPGRLLAQQPIAEIKAAEQNTSS